MKAIIGTMLLPGTGDRILAREGYSDQLTTEPRSGARPDNLFAPPPGDPGAHGRFDNQASGDVVGFEPAWLRAGGLLLVLASIAVAFALGRLVSERMAVR